MQKCSREFRVRRALVIEALERLLMEGVRSFQAPAALREREFSIYQIADRF
jgi:hypothetical protein